jgi:hypothetical protein
MHDDTKIIDSLGGTTRTSQLCEVSPAAVSQWRLNGIPKAQRKFLELARPEAFKAVEQSHPESQPQ